MSIITTKDIYYVWWKELRNIIRKHTQKSFTSLILLTADHSDCTHMHMHFNSSQSNWIMEMEITVLNCGLKYTYIFIYLELWSKTISFKCKVPDIIWNISIHYLLKWFQHITLFSGWLGKSRYEGNTSHWQPCNNA